jgi:hypothetical protein
MFCKIPNKSVRGAFYGISHMENVKLNRLEEVVKAFDDGNLSLDEFHRQVRRFIK